ncbi:hypothetical protein [Streptomyces tauricus]|uniref:hypothetical protein n=1 Tax=Streptomyces tauricus TaxID=68274 RepID=UPI00341D61BF
MLDTPTLPALSGDRQVSALIHRASFEPETRLWAPILSVLEADAEYPGLAEHAGQLDAVHTLDLDYPTMLTVARTRTGGVPAGNAAAIHAARHLPHPGTDALIATVAPKAYETRHVPYLDLNR